MSYCWFSFNTNKNKSTNGAMVCKINEDETRKIEIIAQGTKYLNFSLLFISFLRLINLYIIATIMYENANIEVQFAH
ncbi:hypothetical protein [Mycoplasmopsis cynos]|uniref:hypothetical protein n=1 Tax=Mycoplasmopsis cynos TaxID=171284 RepID=UPI0024CCCB71|nr:hypothetical protein [Mycoplasmopsis cynos]WAM04311.1 hypothetical protein ONA01_04665 [Mycoplasmopsis cynos]